MTRQRRPINRLAHRALWTACLIMSLPAGALAQQGINPHGGPSGTPMQNGGAPSGGIGISISVGDLLRGISSLIGDATRSQQDAEQHESGQLLVLWPNASEAAEGLAQLAQREQLLPSSRYAFDTLGGELALFQFNTHAEAARWRTQLRASYPDWTIDFNARAENLQAPRLHEDGADILPPVVLSSQARLYALRMLGLMPRVKAAAGPPAASVRLGVIDTALPSVLLSPALRDQIWNGSSFAQHSVLGREDTPAPTVHGAAVAQLLAGRERTGIDFAGAAPAGPILWVAAMRQKDQKASTNTWLLAQGFNWLAGQQAQLINLSAGGAGDDILKAVVAQIIQRNITIVAAAGNRPDSKPIFPAAYPGVWAVGAVDAAAQRYAQGSRGDYISLAAPGVDVWVPDSEALVAAAGSAAPVPGRYLSGSSFAAALATGVLAWQPASFWAMAGSARRLQQVCLSARAVEPAQGCGLLQATR